MPRDVLKLNYRYHLERSRFFIKSGLPMDTQEIIEARVHLIGELLNSFVKHLLGIGKKFLFKEANGKKNGSFS